MSHVGFHFHPLKGLLIDPQRSFHASEHFAVAVRWLITRAGGRFQHIHSVPVEASFTEQPEFKADRHLMNERLIALPVSLILGNSLGPLVRGLVLPFSDGFLVLFLFFFL